MKPFATNYTPDSMGFAEGFLAGWRCDGKTDLMIFSYRKAKKILDSLAGIDRAEVGLDGDWKENRDVIFEDGKIKKEKDLYFYRESLWATPILMVWFKSKPQEVYEVFTVQKQRKKSKPKK